MPRIGKGPSPCENAKKRGELHKWLDSTNEGAVNTIYVVKIVRDGEGSIVRLRDGTSVRSSQQFDVANGQLVVVEPDSDCPF